MVIEDSTLVALWSIPPSVYTSEELFAIKQVITQTPSIHILKKVQKIVSRPIIEKETNLTTLLNTYLNALHTEIGELSNELPTRTWRTKSTLDIDAIVKEFADILAFLGVIIMLLEELGISTNTLTQGYWDKTVINMARITKVLTPD